MKSGLTAGFRSLFRALPASVRKQAVRAFHLWRRDPYHNSLQFKRVHPRLPVYSARVGINHRVVGLWEGDRIDWFWIGSHAEYDDLLRRL